MFFKFFSLAFLSCFIYAGNEYVPDTLLKTLYEDQEWYQSARIDGITLSTKTINNMSIKAVKVHVEANIPKRIVTDIIMDIKNYNIHFINSKKLFFQVINRYVNMVDGYQFISVPIPFIKDREHFFRMSSDSFSPEFPNTFIHWYTLKKQIYSDIKTNFQSGKELYISFGAGIWNMDLMDDGTTLISYRLFVDPGGYLPDFAVDHVNKVNIVNLFRDVINEARRRIKIESDLSN